MKGIVFNLLAEAVTVHLGEDAWDEILEKAGASGAYTSLGSYDDDEMTRLVVAAASFTSQPPQDVLRWFGRTSMPMLAERYPEFFAGHTSARDFMLTLNEIIHPEVRKLYPGASPPHFEFDAAEPELLRMRYQSARQLCALADGFIHGAATYFGETVALDHPRCTHRGDEHCDFELRFARVGAVQSAA